MVLWKQRKSPHNPPLQRQNYQVSAFLIQKKGQFVCDLKYLPYLCTRKTERYLFATPFGALVQLVRIHACHAWGHGFESRTHRNKTIIGTLTEWLGSGLQNRVQQFESAGYLISAISHWGSSTFLFFMPDRYLSVCYLPPLNILWKCVV